jgi:hypothetical protein
MAGATGAEVDEIAEEAVARLLMQDGPVNNPKAWVRRTAGELAVRGKLRRRISADDVLAGLTDLERSLVLWQRAGYTTRELARKIGTSEEAATALLAEANRTVRRSSRRLAEQ